MSVPNFNVVVSIDFGTTFSGFGYAHTVNPDIKINDTWPGHDNTRFKAPKNNTVLQYDGDSYENAIAWGYQALAREPERKPRFSKTKPKPKPVERFKLHLGDLKDSDKPYIPKELDYRKAITDFLKSMRPLILETLKKIWPTLEFPQEIRWVVTVPSDWSPEAIGTLQYCMFEAGYTAKKHSNNNLEFTTEPEAAALYCMEKLEEFNLGDGSSFMVVDCGGGTVDLTTRKLLISEKSEKKLSEITERTGDFCGSSYVDEEFGFFLEKKLGFGTVDDFRRNHYDHYQYLIHNFFCPRVKFGFDGDISNFRTIDLDIIRFCPALMKNVVDKKVKEEMEEEDWILGIEYEDVRKMFDPVIEKVIRLIRNQLSASKEKISAVFVVGGFAESPYLVKKIKEFFDSAVQIISVPQDPIEAVLRGGVLYGLNKKIIATRRLTLNYGIEIYTLWKKNVDPKKRMKPDGRIYKFDCLAERGKEYSPETKFTSVYRPVYHGQKGINFKVFATARSRQRFCDEPGMKFVGNLYIELTDKDEGLDSLVEFSLGFGEILITATARNQKTGKIYKTVYFKYAGSDNYFETATVFK